VRTLEVEPDPRPSQAIVRALVALRNAANAMLPLALLSGRAACRRDAAPGYARV